VATPSSRRKRTSAFLLVAVLVACGGGKEAPKEGEKPAADAKPAGDGYQTSYTGYVSKSFPGGLSDTVEAVKSALRGLDLEITGESGGVFEKSVDAEAQDGTSLVATVKEISKDQARVSVKVGYLLGDRDAARRILSEVGGRVAAAKAEAEERRRRWRPSGSGVGMTPTTTTTPPPKR
jgi:Protein of unknown function (DUF3568)